MPEVGSETDVVVLGCGAAGMSVALAAQAAGAEVVILEHQPRDAHTPNLRMSGGFLTTFTDVGGGVSYLAAAAGGLVDEEFFEPWVERSMTLPDTFASMGITLTLGDTMTWGVTRPVPHMWAEHPQLPGAEAVRVWQPTTTLPQPFDGHGPQMVATGVVGRGEAIYRGFMHTLNRRGIEVIWQAATSSLLVKDREDRPAVYGVQFSTPGEARREIRARRGVVLATGGFGGNPDLIRQFLTVPDTRFYGNPGNDGSGLKLAMSVGADLVRMSRMVGRAISSFRLPQGYLMGFLTELHGGGYILIDQHGDRYTDEFDLAQHLHAFYYRMQTFDQDTVSYSRSPSYYIFDERRRKAGPFTPRDRGACGTGIYDWSEDNQREIDAGWIGVGDTPGAAVRAVGNVDPAAVDRTVAEYNDSCASGRDPLGRPADTLIPVAEPPYYCMPLYIGGPYTSGGPRRDLAGRVISVDGRPIPGLYSAGEMGQAIGLMYPSSGASISEACCLGAMTGEAVAAAAPR
jgi:succinate dehydrogenase/fumarate reductase flavoprotein subunit